MSGMMGQTSDSGEIQERGPSGSNDGPSTSQVGSGHQTIIINDSKFTNSTINNKQSMDSKPKIEKLDGFPFTPEVFIGRNGEIENLLRLIQKYPKVLITAIGGMGKTRLAIECAREWVDAGQFTRAIFINVETEQGTNDRFKSLGERLNVNTEVVNVYNYFNNKSPGLTLFVLDNVERTNKIEKFLPPKNSKNIKILATSQEREYDRLFYLYDLDKLTEDKAFELVEALFNQFQVEYKENGSSRADLLSIRKQDIPAIQELVKELDGHPLALQHATALCVNSLVYEEEDDLSQYINTYLKKLQEKISEGFPEGYEVGYERTVFASISLNVEKAIVKSHVQDFLFTMCFMNPTFIELKYFRNCGYFSEIQIKDCKRTLLKHSIIYCRDDHLEDINVHRLVLFICLTMLRKKNLESRKDKLEAHIVGIIFGMYFGDKRAQIYHGQFLFQNTNLEKKDLAGPYINAFQKSHFMFELSARLQRVNLTVEDIEGWGVLHYCKFANDDFWFNYFYSPEINESKNLDVYWPLEIVEPLEDKYAYLDRFSCSKTVVKDMTALHFYAAFGIHLWHFKDLIYKIEDAEIVRSSSLFNIATRNKNYHFGFELLKRGAKYKDKDMALVCAVLGQNLKLTRTLIQEGAEVKFTDDAGLSPVFLAIVTADGTILNELQQHGANIESALNVKDGIKNTALLSVIWGGFVASHDYPNEEFHFFQDRSYLFGRRETEILTSVELLIKYGSDLNCVDRESDTPLMFALRRGYVNVARKLIEFGAEVNRANDYRHTPLMLAKRAGVDGWLIKLLRRRAAICEGYSQSAPTPTASDLKEPELFLNKYWKWRLNTCQEIQTHLEESQNNLKKLLVSTSDPFFKASIQDLDDKIEICLIGLKQKDEAIAKKEKSKSSIDDLDFSFLAKILMDNLYASIKNAIHRCGYDGVGVLETFAKFIFETKFELPANLIDLYDKYVDIKIGNSALRSEKTSENDETEVQLDAARRVHQELAVRLLLPEEKLLPGLEELKKFKSCYENGEDNLVRVGILTLKEGQLTYHNSSLAQYFLSEYLISNFNSEAVQTIFLHKVLMEDKFKLTREFLDSQLELFFQNEELMQNKSDEGHKQLNILKRNRFRILTGAEFTDKVKENVRLTLQGDKDFLLLKRVEDEGRAHIIKYLVKKLENDLDILLRLMRLSDEYDIAMTYLSIAISEKIETFKDLPYYMIEDLNQEIFFLTLKRLLHYFSSKGKTESLKVFLDFLKDKLSQENLVLLVNQTNQDEDTVFHLISKKADSETLKVFLDILKQNLNKENLVNLFQQTNQDEDTVFHLISKKADSETLKVFLEFMKQNLDKENLGNFLQQTDQNENTALHHISYKADIETLQVFLEVLEQNLDKENLVNLLRQTDIYGNTALHRISEKADCEILKVFLQFLHENLDTENLGNLFQQTGQFEDTALHRISRKAGSETLKVFLELLKQNLDKENIENLLHQNDKYGNAALHYISWKADRKTLKVFLKFLQENLDKENLGNLFPQTNEDGYTALHLISHKADSETLKVFLEFLKQNLDKENLGNLLQTNKYEDSALHLVSDEADSKTLKVFLDFLKENLNQEDLKILWEKRDCWGRTAVDRAERRPEKLKILLDFAKDNL